MAFDWTVLDKVGIGGIALVGIWVLYKIVMFCLQQWKSSTVALNRNSASFEKLATVMEASQQRDLEFQKEALSLLNDTNKKVTEMHDKIK